jgi:hypothetical protein
MRVTTVLSLVVVIISTIINGQSTDLTDRQEIPIDRNRFNELSHFPTNNRFQSNILIPFPQCFTSESTMSVINPRSLQDLFQIELKNEEQNLLEESNRNDDLNNGT